MKKIEWTTGKRKLSTLKPAKYNPRKWTEEQTEQLTKSIDKFELADPLIINKDNTIIGGHFRYKILKQKGIKECDVRIPSRKLTLDEEKELNLRLNKNQGEWDFDLLHDDFKIDSLLDVGFQKIELGISEIEFSESPETIKKNMEQMQKIRQMRKASNENIIGKTDSERYLVIVFPDRDEKMKLLDKLGLSADERYLPYNGIEIKRVKQWLINEKSAQIKKAGTQG
jgi:ParB-like chromosome segregation protein Spo0J